MSPLELIMQAVEKVGAPIVLDLIKGGAEPQGVAGPYVGPVDRAAVRAIIYGTGTTLQSEDALERAKARVKSSTAKKSATKKNAG